MQNNPYGNPPPYGAPPGGGFGAPPGGGFGGPPGGFGAPPPGPGAYGPPPGGALEKTKLPAIFMMIAMGIGIAWQLLSLVLNLLGTGMGALGGDAGMANMMSGVVGMVFNFISLFTGGFVIFAMTKMMKGQAWGLALAGVIVGMLPCLGPCCWLGIPIGIWALVVLMDENVKRQFQG